MQIAGLFVVALVAGLVWSRAGLPAEDPIAAYSGSGPGESAAFSTEGPWEIRWEFEGRLFQVSVHSTGGRPMGIAATQMDSGSGRSFQPQAGEYRLQVNASGEWRVEIAPQRSVIESEDAPVRFAGAGSRSTRPFRVRGPWVVRWTASGQLLHAILRRADGTMVREVASQSQPGEGRARVADGGVYYLDVNAMGDWSLEVAPVRE